MFDSCFNLLLLEFDEQLRIETIDDLLELERLTLDKLLGLGDKLDDEDSFDILLDNCEKLEFDELLENCRELELFEVLKLDKLLKIEEMLDN